MYRFCHRRAEVMEAIFWILSILPVFGGAIAEDSHEGEGFDPYCELAQCGIDTREFLGTKPLNADGFTHPARPKDLASKS